MPYKFLKFSSLIILAVLIIFGGWLAFYFQSTQAQSAEYEMAGWIWSQNYEYISLNSDNCKDNPNCWCGGAPCGTPLVKYSVKLGTSNNISGWGWSSNVGWVCFGITCTGSPPGLPSLGETSLDADSGQIKGWAKVISLGDPDGWLKLGRGLAFSGQYDGQYCYNCQPKCLEWSCRQVGDPPQTICDIPPCVRYSEIDYDYCKSCFTETYFNGQKIPDSAIDPIVGGNGLVCSSCTQNCRKETIPGLDVSRIICDNCSGCERYGAGSEMSDGSLFGWGWNGAIDSGGMRNIGAGWTHFNPQGGGGFIVYPWLETKYGSIYARLGREVRQKAGAVGNNATYCIFADSIRNIRSTNCEQAIPNIDFKFPQLSSGEIYRNALGKIDVAGLTRVVRNGRNKYGQEVITITDPNFTGAKVLGRRVYVKGGDLTIDGNLIFNNADDIVKYGNGIIIVNGNLYIENAIMYDNDGVPSNLNQLASVAWIVKGDVIVDPSVEEIAGAFIVLGNGSPSPCASTGDLEFPQYDQYGCGVFFSVNPLKSPDQLIPLKVSGLIAAKAFDFRRTYAKASGGSERIIYDGRLIANPPPGLEGFAEKLPVIRDFSY
ncbi:MAG: hypothetical protein AAB358_01155 [Patescibacteria group bacterium]